MSRIMTLLGAAVPKPVSEPTARRICPRRWSQSSFTKTGTNTTGSATFTLREGGAHCRRIFHHSSCPQTARSVAGSMLRVHLSTPRRARLVAQGKHPRSEEFFPVRFAYPYEVIGAADARAVSKAQAIEA